DQQVVAAIDFQGATDDPKVVRTDDAVDDDVRSGDLGNACTGEGRAAVEGERAPAEIQLGVGGPDIEVASAVSTGSEIQGPRLHVYGPVVLVIEEADREERRAAAGRLLNRALVNERRRRTAVNEDTGVIGP